MNNAQKLADEALQVYRATGLSPLEAIDAERRKHQADIEAWKEKAATAEKWRGLALAKDPMQPGKVVQEIQREAMEREREACANVAELESKVDGMDNHCCVPLAKGIAEAIRDRSHP